MGLLMTSLASATTQPPGAIAQQRQWVGFGLSNLVGVLALSVASWWLLADPQWSPLHLYPLPFNAGLFWAILFVVFIGFCSEFVGFDRLRQPWRGLAIMAGTVVFAVVVTWALGRGLGALFPTFAADRAGGLGWFSGALFVLFGFGTWVMVVLNWGLWPWKSWGLDQPRVGLSAIAFVAIPTLALYVVIGLPSVSESASIALMSNDTVLGWFYCIVVSVILTGQTIDNWPWSWFGEHAPAKLSPSATIALASTIGNVVVGTALYFLALPFLRLLLGSVTSDALGGAIHQFPAQLGVCWAFWMIFWANACGNRPTTGNVIVGRVARAVITFALAVVTFLVYYRWGAAVVLHEPALAPGISGNALGFMDWMVLWTLFYVVGFESWGLRNPSRPDALAP